MHHRIEEEEEDHQNPPLKVVVKVPVYSRWGRKKGRTHCVVGELIEKKYLHKKTLKKRSPLNFASLFSLSSLSLFLSFVRMQRRGRHLWGPAAAWRVSFFSEDAEVVVVVVVVVPRKRLF